MDDNQIYFNSAELYDPTTRYWTNVGNMFVAVERRTTSMLKNGTVLSVNEKVSVSSKENFTTTKNEQLQ